MNDTLLEQKMPQNWLETGFWGDEGGIFIVGGGQCTFQHRIYLGTKVGQWPPFLHACNSEICRDLFYEGYTFPRGGFLHYQDRGWQNDLENVWPSEKSAKFRSWARLSAYQTNHINSSWHDVASGSLRHLLRLEPEMEIVALFGLARSYESQLTLSGQQRAGSLEGSRPRSLGGFAIARMV